MAYPSIVAALHDVQFPANKKKLIDRIGEREIEVLEGKTLSMKELLNSCSHDNYESDADVIQCPEIVSMMRHAA